MPTATPPAPAPPARLWMLHKPRGVVVSRSDEHGRKTVYDILPAWVHDDGWQPVGRLDRDSRGLLLFTREGQLVERLTRPGGLLKVYEVEVRGRVTPEHLAAIQLGVETAIGPLSARSVEVLGTVGPRTRLRVTLDEGKNRHLRRLFGALEDPQHGTPLKVLELKRTAIGPLTLDLPSGGFRPLTPAEEAGLLRG